MRVSSDSDRQSTNLQRDALLAAGVAVFVSDVTDLPGALAVVHDLAATIGEPVPRGAIELPAVFDLALNQKTAGSLGVTLSLAVLAGADEVFE